MKKIKEKKTLISFILKKVLFLHTEKIEKMKVNLKTKVSELIKHDRGVVDVIASINKHFRKLKNPILCKMLASRVTIKDAARIGKVDVNDFLKRLEDYGFEVEYPVGKTDDEIDNKKTLNMDKNNLVTLDARPILEGGVDPFEEIMKTLKGMDDNQTLLVINTFEPIPLLNLLKKKGYDYQVERPEPGVVYSYLRKSANPPKEEPGKEKTAGANADFDSVEKQFAGKMREVDVHEMEMPMPMVTILEELENLKEGEALYVHHKQLPQYLLPELENRGFKHAERKVDDNNLKMIIYK